MDKVQVLYVLVSSPKDIYLEEMWVSIYSLRLYDMDRRIVVLCDIDTAKYIHQFPDLESMITEIISIELPDKYNTAKLKSRQLKTNAREYIDGAFLFIDTDTTVCGTFDYIDELAKACEVPCIVLDTHLPVKDIMFSEVEFTKSLFDLKEFVCEKMYNSGVMYIPENPKIHQFYNQWNKNWHYSTFKKNISQDQPALLKTNMDMNFIIQDLPGIYNAQVTLSMKYFADAIIIHWWHLKYIKDQSFNPFLSGKVYNEIKTAHGITEPIANLIKNVKQSYESPSTVIGRDQIYFAYTNAFNVFCQIHKEGGVASWLMHKSVPFFEWLRKTFPKKK